MQILSIFAYFKIFTAYYFSRARFEQKTDIIFTSYKIMKLLHIFFSVHFPFTYLELLMLCGRLWSCGLLTHGIFYNFSCTAWLQCVELP